MSIPRIPQLSTQVVNGRSNSTWTNVRCDCAGERDWERWCWQKCAGDVNFMLVVELAACISPLISHAGERCQGSAMWTTSQEHLLDNLVKETFWTCEETMRVYRRKVFFKNSFVINLSHVWCHQLVYAGSQKTHQLMRSRVRLVYNKRIIEY